MAVAVCLRSARGAARSATITSRVPSISERVKAIASMSFLMASRWSEFFGSVCLLGAHAIGKCTRLSRAQDTDAWTMVLKEAQCSSSPAAGKPGR